MASPSISQTSQKTQIGIRFSKRKAAYGFNILFAYFMNKIVDFLLFFRCFAISNNN